MVFVTLALGLAVVWWFLLRKPSRKMDDATRMALESVATVEKKCQPLVNAVLSKPVIDDEAQCAQQMRDIVAGCHLSYSTLATNPGLLLRASRHVATAPHGGLHTRFTVSFNLYAGTVVALGSDQQREELYQTQSSGELGCFAFTEKAAGVLSGAAVETTATFDKHDATFVINSPSDGAVKNWISQGCFAERAVILANLIDGEGENHGPHLFWARIGTVGDSGATIVSRPTGVEVGSVPQKTAMRGLDNATIRFSNFKVKCGALLSRFASVDTDGKYNATQLPKGCKRMADVLFSRLLTGRICLSEYTSYVASDLLRRSWRYCQGRELWRGRKDKGKKMAEMSNVEAIFRDYTRANEVVAHFIAGAREQVARAIETDEFSASASENACISKFVGTSFAVDVCSVLRKTLGSQALLADSWLGASSFVCNATCAAEGDNTVMELKIISDVIRKRSPVIPTGISLSRVLSVSAGRKAFGVYVTRLVTAMLKGKSAIKDGQLLRDLAWARAHLIIVDAWVKSGKSQAFLDSYEHVCVRFPVPVAF